jgi:Transposase
MAKKRFSPEQVVAKLRQIEVLTAGGKALPLACKEAGITDVTYYRWRKEYGGLKADQAKKLPRLTHRVISGNRGSRSANTKPSRSTISPTTTSTG